MMPAEARVDTSSARVTVWLTCTAQAAYAGRRISARLRRAPQRERLDVPKRRLADSIARGAAWLAIEGLVVARTPSRAANGAVLRGELAQLWPVDRDDRLARPDVRVGKHPQGPIDPFRRTRYPRWRQLAATCGPGLERRSTVQSWDGWRRWACEQCWSPVRAGLFSLSLRTPAGVPRPEA